jgi:hypothetical protein
MHMANPKQVTTDFTLARTSLIMGAYALAKNMRQRQHLVLVREPTSTVSPNDVMVVLPGAANRKIGYLPPGLANKIAPLMDKGVKVIAQKAPNVLYGVCQLAYIPPDEEPVVEAAPAPVEPPPIVPIEQAAVPESVYDPAPLTSTPSRADLVAEGLLPEGVTQADLDAGTELPPLGDSRRPHRKELPNDEPTPDDDSGPQEAL